MTNPEASSITNSKLSRTALKGGAWLGLAAVFQAALQIAIVAVLARLLSPADFGLVAIATIFVDILSGLANVGVSEALVQRGNLQNKHISAAFYLSIGVGLATTSFLYFSAPIIALILGSSNSSILIQALSFVFIVQSLGFVSAGLAARARNFRVLALRKLVGYVIGFGVVGIASATSGNGPWALVHAQLSQAAITSALLIYSVRFKLLLVFERRYYLDVLAYGTGLSASRLINSLANQIDRAIVSANTNVSAIGLYTRALQIMRYPTLLVGQVIEDVLFPTFSSAQHDKVRLKSAILRSLGILFLAMTPLAAFLAILAAPITSILLGSQWLDAAVLVTVFALSIPFRSAQRVAASALRALGYPWGVACIQAFLLLATIAGSFVGIKFGLAGAAIAVTVAYIAHYFVMVSICAVLLNMDPYLVVAKHILGAPISMVVILVGWSVMALERSLPPLVQITSVVLIVGLIVTPLIILWPRLFMGVDGLWILRAIRDKLLSHFKLINNRDQ